GTRQELGDVVKAFLFTVHCQSQVIDVKVTGASGWTNDWDGRSGLVASDGGLVWSWVDATRGGGVLCGSGSFGWFWGSFLVLH
ncbi:unnamed protein product, partial [Tetraodon nigroviridis]